MKTISITFLVVLGVLALSEMYFNSIKTVEPTRNELEYDEFEPHLKELLADSVVREVIQKHIDHSVDSVVAQREKDKALSQYD